MITKQLIKLPFKKHIVLEVVDARTIILHTTSNTISTYPTISNSKTILSIGEYFHIDLQRSLNTLCFLIENEHGEKRAIVYNIRKILAVNENTFSLFTHERTISSYFITPMLLNKEFTKSNISWDRYFINTYLVQLPNTQERVIGLLYRFFPVSSYLRLETLLTNHPNFISLYELDYSTTLFLFKYPPKYINDLQTLYNSTYSIFSNSLKEKILKFFNATPEHELNKILYKEESRRKQLELHLGEPIPTYVELFDRFEPDAEVLNIDNFILPNNNATQRKP